MHRLDFFHHRCINGEPARGIHNQHVTELNPGVLQRGPGDVDRLLSGVAGKEACAYLTCQCLQLFDGSRAIDIGTDDHYFLAVAFDQQFGELRNRGGLACALQSRHQDYRRRGDRQMEPLVGGTHGDLEFRLHDFQEGLPRTEALHHLLPERPLLHGFDKILDHRQRDVGLKQGHAHLAKGVLDVVFGEPRLA